MINREQILKRFIKIEDKLLVSKLLDKALKAEKTGGMTYSDFLDPYQRNVVEKAVSDLNEVECTFTGGYIGAERVITIFRPYFVSEDDLLEPLKVLYISGRGRAGLSHRDYLGSLIGLGIKREKIGDILVKSDVENAECQIIVVDEIADFIQYNLERVGSQKVSVEKRDLDDLEVAEPEMREIRSSVASLRLDSIASAGFGMSRSKIAELIRGEKVSLEWEVTDSLTKQVKEGDTISIRGKGRVVLEKVCGVTKKGRTSVILKKYI